MRDHSKHIQVNKQEAVDIITAHCTFTPQAEEVPVEDAIGRVLASDVCANWDSPNTLTCRMDSVAVHWADFAQGMPDTSDWERGKQWEFANTGVGMPQGFDTAIVVEHVIFSEDDTKVAFDAMPSGQYAGTSQPGSKMKAGDLLVPKGTVITPLLAAHIVSGNVTSVSVVKKPMVLFMPTGNELVHPGREIPKGKNIESNSYMIAAKIREWGGEPIVSEIVPDSKEALKEALHSAAAKADIIVLNAGSSKGNDDWGIEMLEEEGTIYYHQTNHGPGHHSSFGVLDETPVVGISGPPGGAAFTTDYYLYPAMMVYYGMEPMLRKITVRLAEEIAGGKMHKKPDGHRPKAKGEDRPMEGGEFYSVKQLILKQGKDGVMEAYPTRSMRPGPLEAEGADAYYLMPTWEGKKPLKAGDMIEVELRPKWS
ncbi:MAG: molybdopterin molybdotransferase MoeA [Eubacterium sp.]|nr:molybdopterin molybdotransferase MoeA [Eubacterium sp.]